MTRVPRRDELAGATVEVLTSGARTKADVIVVDVGDGPIVVKDFGQKPWWARSVGRVQIAREVEAYRRLDGLEGVPHLVGRIDAHALAVEWVEGEQLAFHPRRFEDGPAFVARLRAVVDRLHERGVVHNDLRGRENVLVRPDGGLVVVDFAGALRLKPGGWVHRNLFGLLAMADEAAYLKWKALLTPGAFTSEEEAFLERFRKLRRLWPFNRKAARRGEP